MLAIRNHGETDAAITVFRLIAEWYPSSTRGWEGLCYAFRERGEKERALQACREGLRWVDEDPGLTEHGRELRKNGLTEALGQLRS